MATEKYSSVKAVQDDSSHWYVIPEELYKEFQELSDKICRNEDDQDLVDEFEKKFSHFRTGGSLNNVQLYKKHENE